MSAYQMGNLRIVDLTKVLLHLPADGFFLGLL